MFERFTDEARRAVVVAQEEARELRAERIEPVHLLTAMLNQDGKLTDIGSWYMGGVATNVVPKGAGGRIQTIGLPIATSLAVFWAFML